MACPSGLRTAIVCGMASTISCASCSDDLSPSIQRMLRLAYLIAMSGPGVGSVFEVADPAPQHGDRGFRERERGRRPLKTSRYGRLIRIGTTVRPIVDPHILLAPKGHERYRPCERRLTLALRILK